MRNGHEIDVCSVCFVLKLPRSSNIGEERFQLAFVSHVWIST